ncbi:Cytochrome c biogenesis protein CcsA [Bienertia sinuspersici]
MGTTPSTPRNSSFMASDTVEYIIATFVGEKSFPLNSEFWQKLVELPLQSHWPPYRVRQACESLGQSFFRLICLSFFYMHCIMIRFHSDVFMKWPSNFSELELRKDQIRLLKIGELKESLKHLWR